MKCSKAWENRDDDQHNEQGGLYVKPKWLDRRDIDRVKYQFWEFLNDRRNTSAENCHSTEDFEKRREYYNQQCLTNALWPDAGKRAHKR